MEVREDFDQLPYYFEVQCDYCGKPFVTTKQRYKKIRLNAVQMNVKTNYINLSLIANVRYVGKKYIENPIS